MSVVIGIWFTEHLLACAKACANADGIICQAIDSTCTGGDLFSTNEILIFGFLMISFVSKDERIFSTQRTIVFLADSLSIISPQVTVTQIPLSCSLNYHPGYLYIFSVPL